jgi:Secretion system C-terminal sorting domain
MNSKITFLLIIFYISNSFCQTPINNYFGTSGNSYDIVTPATPLDQTPVGANVVWNFNSLTANGQSVDSNAAPTSAELTTFPGSTNASSIASTVGGTTTISSIFSKNVANTISLTGFVANTIELNYVTNNAKIGTFPLTYGYNFTDTSAGTFISGGYNGTFTGNIITKIDAYGTLNVADSGNGAFSGAVTRLKTVQNINLFYGFFGNVGTVVITNYAYFDTANILQFRNSEIIANIPLLMINQTLEQSEDYFVPVFSSDEFEKIINSIKIYPNPANNILNIESSENDSISQIKLFDINGREILKQNSSSKILDLSTIEKGIYFIEIKTDKGIFNDKIIKN